jgi:hypothetical protein
MSTLQVANIHLESTANNRIQYNGSNTLTLVTGGSNSFIANSSSITISAGGANNLIANSTTTQLQVNSSNVVVANSTTTMIQVASANAFVSNSTVTTLAVNGTTELTVNATAAVFAGTVADATATLRPFVNATAVALSVQSTVDFNDIPSWVKKISVVFFAVSLTGTDQPLIQLGTGTSGSPSFATSGYQSYNSDSGRTSTAGFIGPGGSAGDSRYGVLQIINQDGLKWVAWGIINSATSNEQRTIGQVTLGGTLTQLRLTRTGTNTFDAGNINILYE